MGEGASGSRGTSIGELDRLPWRRLARFCADTRVPAHHRKVAEQRLALRIEGLALGAQIALARIAPRAVLADLARLREPAVFEAIMGNPRTTVADMTAFLQDPDQSPEILRSAAEHHRWGATIPLRILLVTHPATPVHTALTVLAALPEGEVSRLLADGSLPPVVAIQAGRRQDGKPE